MQIKYLLFFLSIFIYSFGQAKDLYWIGDSGDWNDPAHWSLTSGGPACNQVPNSKDHAIFDNNSFDIVNAKVTFDQIKVSRLSVNSPNNPIFEGKSLEIIDGLKVVSNIGWPENLVFNSVSDGFKTIETGGQVITADVSLTEGEWELLDNLVLGRVNKLSVQNETFKTNDNGLSAGEIVVTGAKLYAGNSEIHFFDEIDLENAVKKGSGKSTLVEKAIGAKVNTGDYPPPVTPPSSTTCSGITVTASVTSNYNGSDISCNGACDGEITVSATGTPGPYSYSLNGGTITSNTVYSNLCAGSYIIVVTDSSQFNGVTYETCILIYSVAATPSIIIVDPLTTIIPPSCHNTCDGQAFIQAAGGTGPYTFLWENGETDQNPDSLCTGYNSVTITDVNNCVGIDSVLIVQPVDLTYDVTVTLPSCNGDTDGAITISNEIGGNGGPYTYNYNPAPTAGQGTNNATGYGAALVTVSVFDVDGCQQDSLIVIADPPELFANTVNPNDASCFGVCDGSVSALPAGGIPGYTFEWFDDATGLTTGITDSTATGLCAGDYYVVITDANGCSRQSLPVTIGQPVAMTFSFTNTNVACLDSCTGVAIATVNGGAGGYVYSWIDLSTGNPIGGNNATISDLCPGQYEITVTDANGCSSEPDTADILNALPLDIVFTSSSPDCYDICNGEITATPTNSTGFNYAWDHGPTTQTVTGLCVAGDYIVTVTDDSGCVEVDTFNLVVPDVYDITVNTTDLICFENTDGAIDLTVNLGGNGGPYTYTWTPAGITGDGTPNVSGLSPGNYSVVVTDAAGLCDTTLTFTLTSPPDLTISGTDIMQISCNGACDGQISALPAGGTPGYTYQWINNANGTVISTDSILTALCAGDYYVRVTDANGCIDSSAVITIIEPTPIVVTTTGYNLSCFDICDGAVTVDVTGGSPAYNYLWTDIGTGTNVGISDSISGLCPGQYSIVITDATGCSTPADTVTVLNAPQLDLNLVGTGTSCFGDCDGSIAATLINGVGLITWSPVPNAGQGTANASYTNLCSGFYTIDAIDANGCTISDTITIDDSEPYNIVVNEGEISCFGGNDGFIALDVITGGNGGPYTYNWLPPTVLGAGTDSIFGLSSGFYQVTISDGTCDTTMLFTLTDPDELIATANVISQPLCAGDCAGSGDIIATGGAPNYSILWNDPSNSTTNVISNLCVGTYIGTITDSKGCTAVDSIIISDPTPFNFTLTTTDNTCFGACDGSATISGLTGGTPTYTIQWNDPLNQTGLTATNLCAGVYQVTITDANNCDTIVPVTIIDPAEIVLTTTLVDGACFGSCSGETSVSVVGGVAPLNYEWYNVNSNIPIALTDVNPNLCPGDYYVIVTDAGGCSVISDTLTVTEFPEIIIDLVSFTNATCGANDGDATISASGGSGTLTYSWSPVPPVGAGTPSISSLAGGIYTVTVTDQNGCSDSLAVAISSNALEVLTVDSIDVSCFGLSDGEVSVSFTCLEPNCTIQWYDAGGNPVGTNNTLTGLPAGLYFVELTNGLGCTVIDSTFINDANEIIASITSTDINCFGDANGTADVVATGGAGGLTYNWSPNPNGGQATPNATGLTGGVWNVTVTDINNCSVDLATTINEPAELTLDVLTSTNISCFGTNDGTLGAAASGGTGILSYEWFSCVSGLSVGTTAALTGVAPGDYFVVVTDENNCNITSNCIEVEDYQQITAILNSTNVNCFGDCDGLVYAVTSGGNGNYFLPMAR